MDPKYKTLLSAVIAIVSSQFPGVGEIIHEAGGPGAVIAAGAALTGVIRGIWHLVEDE